MASAGSAFPALSPSASAASIEPDRRWNAPIVEHVPSGWFFNEAMPLTFVEIHDALMHGDLRFPAATGMEERAVYLSRFALSTAKLEDTVGSGVDSTQLINDLQGGLAKLPEDLVAAKDYEAWLTEQPGFLSSCPWAFDAAHPEAARPCRSSQLLAMGSAMAFLWNAAASGAPLTIDTIVNAHTIMAHGSNVDPGLRASRIFFGEMEGAAPDTLTKRLNTLCCEFEEWMETKHPVWTAATFMFKILRIHPFLDGNGRMARMLAAYSLIRAGVGVPVVISSGRKNSRRHYYYALKRGDFGQNSALLSLVACSVIQACRFYEEY